MVDFDVLMRQLLAQKVEFVIVGGFAATAHGVSIVTQDIDVFCPFSRENLLRLQAAVQDLHPFHRLTRARLPLELTEENVPRLKNLSLETDVAALDCLSEVKGVGDFAEVRRQSVAIELPAGCCRILGIEALIQAKKAMGGPRDQLTILQLEAIKERIHSNPSSCAKSH